MAPFAVNWTTVRILSIRGKRFSILMFKTRTVGTLPDFKNKISILNLNREYVHTLVLNITVKLTPSLPNRHLAVTIGYLNTPPSGEKSIEIKVLIGFSERDCPSFKTATMCTVMMPWYQRMDHIYT